MQTPISFPTTVTVRACVCVRACVRACVSTRALFRYSFYSLIPKVARISAEFCKEDVPHPHSLPHPSSRRLGFCSVHTTAAHRVRTFLSSAEGLHTH